MIDNDASSTNYPGNRNVDSAYNALGSEEMDTNGEAFGVAAPTRRIVRTWVGQFSIVAGQAQEQGPCLGLFQGSRADGESVDLFVLVEPMNPGSDQYSQQIIDAIADLIQQEQLSMTGGLVRSVRAAHETLLDWNRKSLREHQVGVGISCLAVRNEFAYLAQAGPSIAHVWSGDSIEQITPELDEATKPLGTDGQFYPEVRRIELHDGTMILLSTPALSDLLDIRSLAEIFKRGPEEAVMDLYARTRHLTDFSLVLIAATAEHVPVEHHPVTDATAATPRPVAEAPSPNGIPGPVPVPGHLPTAPHTISEPGQTMPSPAAFNDDRGATPPLGAQRVFPAPPAPAVDEPAPDIDDYAFSEGPANEGGGLTPPRVAYAPPVERKNTEESLAQRMRRFFGVDEQPDEPDRTPSPVTPSLPDHAALADSGPVPASPPPRSPHIYRNVQSLPPIGLEPDRWQTLIDRLARLGWPVLAIGALVVIGLLIGAWCVVL